MIQLILMGIGLVYTFKLLAMNSNTGSELGLGPEVQRMWQSHKRKRYLWMIAAGWGSFLASIGVSFVVGAGLASNGNLTQESANAADIVILLVSMVMMFACWAFSSREEEQAKLLASARPVRGSHA